MATEGNTIGFRLSKSSKQGCLQLQNFKTKCKIKNMKITFSKCTCGDKIDSRFHYLGIIYQYFDEFITQINFLISNKHSEKQYNNYSKTHFNCSQSDIKLSLLQCY